MAKLITLKSGAQAGTFQRAAGVSWSKGTARNISSTTHKERSRREKFCSLFPSYSKLHFKREIEPIDGSNQGIFSKSGHPFLIFKKRQWRLPTSPTSCVPVN